MDRQTEPMNYEKLKAQLGGLNILMNLRNEAGYGTLYRKPYNAKTLLVKYDGVVFDYDLDNVTYLCASPEGLQLQESGRNLSSFFIDGIEEVELVHG